MGMICGEMHDYPANMGFSSSPYRGNHPGGYPAVGFNVQTTNEFEIGDLGQELSNKNRDFGCLEVFATAHPFMVGDIQADPTNW